MFTVVVVVFLFYRYKTYKLHSYEAIGSLSNENGKKVVRLVKKNNFARASHFFVHFLAVVARLQREIA